MPVFIPYIMYVYVYIQAAVPGGHPEVHPCCGRHLQRDEEEPHHYLHYHQLHCCRGGRQQQGSGEQGGAQHACGPDPAGAARAQRREGYLCLLLHQQGRLIQHWGYCLLHIISFTP